MGSIVSPVAAVDLGATSGRVVLSQVSQQRITMETVARFPNKIATLHGSLHWNVVGLYQNVLEGLKTVAAHTLPASIGIDSWAVDYGLLANERLLGDPYHYRDARNVPAAERAHQIVPFSQLYPQNGLQFLPFNTLYQLVAEQTAPVLGIADRLLLIPDLIAYWLTGTAVAEATNASTTGLLDVTASKPRWNTALMDALEIPQQIFPPLAFPGDEIGRLEESVAREIGFADQKPPVIAVGSHDTASAVVAVPAEDSRHSAYISCGTWALVGAETTAPILSTEAREANFTNEGGVDGRNRFLRNVMGLWVLTETLRQWEQHDTVRGGQGDDGLRGEGEHHLPALLAQAADCPAPTPALHVNDPYFAPPGDMSSRILSYLRERQLPEPASRPEMVRLILESLAQAFAEAVQTTEKLANLSVQDIHVVGGGAQNQLLCQLVADYSGRTVIAGPVEATACGNSLIQARSVGLVTGDLESLRQIVRNSFQIFRYTPR